MALAIPAAIPCAASGMFTPEGMKASAQGRFSTKERKAGSFLPKAWDPSTGIMDPDQVIEATHVNEMPPVGCLLSPTGEHWFYTIETTGDLLNDALPYNRTWNFKTFMLTVYDGRMNIVGYAHGEAEFPEGAARCQSITPALQVTSNFFNSSTADYEVVLTFNFNPDDKKGLYGAKQTSQVYSLKKSMPAAPEAPLFTAKGTMSSAINGSTTTSQGFVLSFTDETTWDSERDQADKTTIRVYKGAGWGTPPELIAQQTTSVVPGDGMNDPNPFFIVVHGSDVYSVRTYYEQPWLDDSGDMVMRPDNTFIIELYKPTAKNPIITDHTDPDAPKVEPYKTVRIPCGDPSSDQYAWRSYALGNFRAENDVTWDFSEGGADPCFVVTIVDSNVQDESVGFYEVYDINGNKIKEFGKESGAYAYFPAIEGHPDQFGFDVLDSEGSTVTQLVDWPSLEVKGQIPALFEYEGNIFTLSSVPTRVAGDGGVLYAANAVPSMSIDESAFSYVAYFYPDGTLRHVDTLRLPENTAKAYAYVTAEVLDPYLYNTDSNYEYLIWLYTWKGEGKIGTDLSLAVVDNTGKVLAKRGLPDNHSNENAFVSNHPDERYIVMSWRNASSFLNKDQMEFIKLPLNDFEGEGTVEDPYLVKTYGDFDRIRNNLTSHFALAGNINLEGRAMRPIEGTFLGSLDGRGHVVRDLYVSGENRGALFMNVGERSYDDEEAPIASIRDITFSNALFAHGGNNLGTKQYAILAHTARNAEFSKVAFVNPKFELAGVNTEFGTLAYLADNCVFTDCAVKDAAYDIERARGLGGIAFDIRASKVTGSYVTGSLKGNTNVGGVVAVANSYPSAVSDCHVDASIAGSGNVGGVIATNNSRSSVKNCVVEGTIAADRNAGGIVGELATLTDIPEAEMLVENNVVALSALDLGENAEAAHRVVGYTSIDDGAQLKWVDNPDWNPDDPSSSAGSYQEIPALPEEKIGVNHVIGGIPAVDPAEGLATEGTTTADDAVDEEFFAGLGFRYGQTSEEPWTRPTFMRPIPALYYEEAIGATIEFIPAVYSAAEGETIKVVVEIEGFDPMDVFGSGLAQFGSADESVASFNGMMDFVPGSSSRVQLDVVCGQAGTTALHLEYKGIRATATVEVKAVDSVSDAVAEATALSYDGATVTAEGRKIAVFDTRGRVVTTGFGSLSTGGLIPGIYIVTADGAPGALKIVVR